MSADTPGLGPFVQQAYHSVDSAITKRLQSLGYSVTPSHSAVLANIDIATGTRPSELARRAGVTKQAMGQVVDELEQRGFVVRRPDPADARAKLVQLSDSGRALMDAALEVIAELERSVTGEVGERAVATSRRVLETLATLAADHDAR